MSDEKTDLIIVANMPTMC